MFEIVDPCELLTANAAVAMPVSDPDAIESWEYLLIRGLMAVPALMVAASLLTALTENGSDARDDRNSEPEVTES